MAGSRTLPHYLFIGLSSVGLTVMSSRLAYRHYRYELLGLCAVASMDACSGPFEVRMFARSSDRPTF